MDGLHCFIRWRIVIHGCINGYSKKVIYIHASDNNRANTVLNLFLESTTELDWPSRVRSDKGGENYDVARAMLTVQGTGRGSHIAGPSVHNQRIEHLWRDTFRCVCHIFYALFYEMEEMNLLSPTDELQLYAIHYVFIPGLNKQLKDFKCTWNSHPLQSEHGFIPNQLRLQGWSECNFDCDIDTEYGAEEGRQNPFDMGRVEVPRIAINLSAAQKQLLNSRFNPLRNSDCNGFYPYIDVYDSKHY